MSKHDPFRFLSSIQRTKDYQFNSEEDEKEYNPVFTNVGLSQHIDSVLYANEMNKAWQTLPKKAQYDYLFTAIRQLKRPYIKWVKKRGHEHAELIMEAYGVNYNRAIEYLKILTKEQIDNIKKSLDTI